VEQLTEMWNNPSLLGANVILCSFSEHYNTIYFFVIQTKFWEFNSNGRISTIPF